MKLNQRQRLAALFVSFTIVIIGGASLLYNMSVDYYSVSVTLKNLLPAAIIIGALGWIMGMILEKPEEAVPAGYNQLMLQELTNQDSEEISDANAEISEILQEIQIDQEKENSDV